MYFYNFFSLGGSIASFFLVAPGFELRASYPDHEGRHSNTWAMPPALFALVIFEIGSGFFPIPAWTMILTILGFPLWMGWQALTTTLSFYLSTWGFANYLCPDWPETVILPYNMGCQASPSCLATGWDAVLLTIYLGWLLTVILQTSAPK
jgi:hypothetical protein